MKKTATKVAWKFVGTFYRWGGDDPSGFDCSGLIVEILKSVGRINRKSDYTAQGLYDLFQKENIDIPHEGCLVFWGKSKNRITHVEYCIDTTCTIGASGGGSKTNSKQDSIDQNAYVKVRTIRDGYVAVVDPF